MHAATTSELLTLHRKLWTSEEVARLVEIFPESHYELIEGELIDKMGQKPLHALVVAILTELLANAFPGRVRIQSSITLPHPDSISSEPEPDAVLLHGNIREFADTHPTADDIALLVEVSDTTFAADRTVKYRLYARAGIREYWIVDAPNQRVIVCVDPDGEDYRSVTIFTGNSRIYPAAAPDFCLSPEQLFA